MPRGQSFPLPALSPTDSTYYKKFLEMGDGHQRLRLPARKRQGVCLPLLSG